MRKVYIESLGCAKNQVDAEVMLKQLEAKGYERTEEVAAADLVLVNTCGFIDTAREESVDTFFSLRKQNPKAKFVVTGCMAQRYADELFKELPEADAIFGNRDLKEIGTVVDQVEAGERAELVPEYPDPDNDAWQRDELFGYPGSAFLKISEGCNHWCSYCAIPLIRGELRSRPMDQILEETRSLAAKGVREINVIAQDLAAYGSDWDGKRHFRELMEALVRIPGQFRYRMLYIHPDWFPEWLPAFVKEHEDKVMPYFDVPMQHAAVEVLSKMGRAGNPQTYLALVEAIRKELPDAVIRTTIMTGFPGETEESQRTVKEFLKKAQFDWMGVFCYSREQGTKGYTMRSGKEHAAAHKKAVLYKEELESLQSEISHKRLERFVGKSFPVLIEEPVKGEELALGRIYGQAPDVDGLTVVIGSDLKPGSVVQAGIRSVKDMDLEAVALEDSWRISGKCSQG